MDDKTHGWCCDCTPGELGGHCEGHFEERLRACKPCDKFPEASGHALQDDFNGVYFCSACDAAEWDRH